MPTELKGLKAATPAANHLFDVRDDEPNKGEETRTQAYHRITIQLLYLSQRARPDLRLGYSRIGVTKCDWKKKVEQSGTTANQHSKRRVLTPIGWCPHALSIFILLKSTPQIVNPRLSPIHLIIALMPHSFVTLKFQSYRLSFMFCTSYL